VRMPSSGRGEKRGRRAANAANTAALAMRGPPGNPGKKEKREDTTKKSQYPNKKGKEGVPTNSDVTRVLRRTHGSEIRLDFVVRGIKIEKKGRATSCLGKDITSRSQSLPGGKESLRGKNSKKKGFYAESIRERVEGRNLLTGHCVQAAPLQAMETASSLG